MDPKVKTFRLQKFMPRTVLIAIFDKPGVIHKEFTHDGQTVNSAFYVGVIGRSLKRISRARPQFRTEGSWLLLHDSALPQRTLVVKIFRTKHGVVEISRPHHSPNIAPTGFLLFQKVKTFFRGKRFQGVEDIKKHVTAGLNAVPFEAVTDVFSKHFKPYNRCIQVDGDYFE